jgi:hypothetical protein
MKIKSQFLSVALLVASLAVLPGCDSFKSCSSCSTHTNAGSGEVVITLGGSPLIKSENFEKKLAMIYQARQGIEAFIANMPEEEQLKVYEQIANGLVAEQLILDYVKKNKLDQAADYRELADQAHRQLEVDLALRAFQNALVKEVQDKITDEEAAKFYADHREKMPIFQQAPFLINAEEMKAKGAKAGTKAQYAPFEMVRELVKQVIVNDRVPALSEEKMDLLKKDNAVTINTEYLKKFVVKKEAAADQAVATPAEAPVPAKPKAVKAA